MGPTDVIDLARDAIWVLIKVAGPVMMVGLLIGLVVSLVQSVTQIQEMTLTFVPKVLVILVSLLALLPFMLQTLTSFTESLVSRIISG